MQREGGGNIALKRAYERAARDDGARFLVERLWPRGVRKDALAIDAWLKEVAPTTELRKWFNHDPARWDEFRRRYVIELQAHPQSWQPLVQAVARGAVTLVYSAHDTEHNAAVALREFLEHQLGRGRNANGRPR